MYDFTIWCVMKWKFSKWNFAYVLISMQILLHFSSFFLSRCISEEKRGIPHRTPHTTPRSFTQRWTRTCVQMPWRHIKLMKKSLENESNTHWQHTHTHTHKPLKILCWYRIYVKACIHYRHLCQNADHYWWLVMPM